VNGETRHPAPRAAERDRTAERALQQAKAVKYGIRERERAKERRSSKFETTATRERTR
jgi:hypothetical protein